MKIALCTTTINVPTVLELYRKLGPDVAFFIAGDLKSPHEEISALCRKLGNTRYIIPQEQKKWKCSELIGWNCIQRRNIAYLEALKWGAEVIVTIDDDNIPVGRGYFTHFDVFNELFNGLQISTINGSWFDPGSLLIPPAKHRGIPYNGNTNYIVSSAVGGQVGVAAGMCLGNPDVDAVTRMARAPTVHGVSELLNAGIVVDARCRTMWNSQNTAFVRELVPALFLWPGVGRSDDLLASLVCQRAMRDRGYVVHFGKPYTWQSRNQHNLLTDLKAEMFGMECIPKMADWLDGFQGPPASALLEDVRGIFQKLPTWCPAVAKEAGLAFLEDVESTL